MTKKQPWIDFPAIWPTEARFITWVRGVLRKGWSNNPIKIEYLNSRKVKIVNTNPKSMKAHPTVAGYVCEQCGKETKSADVEVDHAGAVQGKFTCMDDIQGYAEHLFLVDFDSLEVVCKPCHKIRSYAQKQNISFEDAAIEKEIIHLMKQPVEDVLAFCNDYQYDVSKLTNTVKRREAVTQILKGVK